MLLGFFEYAQCVYIMVKHHLTMRRCVVIVLISEMTFLSCMASVMMPASTDNMYIDIARVFAAKQRVYDAIQSSELQHYFPNECKYSQTKDASIATDLDCALVCYFVKYFWFYGSTQVPQIVYELFNFNECHFFHDTIPNDTIRTTTERVKSALNSGLLETSPLWKKYLRKFEYLNTKIAYPPPSNILR